MPDRELLTSVANRLQPLRLFWMAEIATLIIFGVVVRLAPPEPSPAADHLGLVLGLVAVVQCGVVFFIRYRTMGTVALTSPDDLRVEQSVEGPALWDAVAKATGRYVVGTIIGLALAESVAILGVVDAWIAGTPMRYLPYGLFALVLVLVQVPTRNGMMALLTGEERRGLRRLLRED